MMKSYLDTSVLFPAMTTAHPDHQRYQGFFQQVLEQGEVVYLSMHVCAELYANLTRFPLGKKIPPHIAVESIFALEKIVTTIDLTRSDYEAALHRCATLGLTSGIIYDALHVQAAVKAGVDVLYTANLRDFHRLLTPEVTFEVKGLA